jgi:hypothetical protein
MFYKVGDKEYFERRKESTEDDPKKKKVNLVKI